MQRLLKDCEDPARRAHRSCTTPVRAVELIADMHSLQALAMLSVSRHRTAHIRSQIVYRSSHRQPSHPTMAFRPVTWILHTLCHPSCLAHPLRTPELQHPPTHTRILLRCMAAVCSTILCRKRKMRSPTEQERPTSSNASRSSFILLHGSTSSFLGIIHHLGLRRSTPLSARAERTFTRRHYSLTRKSYLVFPRASISAALMRG
jgi:hypothetical protein